MALSGSLMLARDEYTQDGSTSVISGVTTVKDIVVYVRRHDDDGPQANFHMMQRWDTNEPWVTFGNFSLDPSGATINGWSTQFLADEVRVDYEFHGQGQGGVDIEIHIEGRG